MQLLDLCETLNDYERGPVRAIIGLIPAIYDCNMRALSEAHFSASYIHPLMTGLFSCKRPSKVAHCPNTVADENATINNNRPDYKVDVYEAYEYAYTNVYGEIKPTKNISSSLLVNDFCRVAIFCNDACDELKLDHIIGFQVAGPSITWFGMHLQQDQLYTFTEIAAIDIPMKKSELLNLVGRLDDLMLVVKIHKTLCSPSTTIADNLRCPTHPLWYAGNGSETKSNKKRKVSLTLGD
ncbi:hypothetical protein DFQ30_003671 [Apophysomyces sp. BC1015]|nr:hypothetical protein DFQ30_003671 [Apophysomyces sp. BC1015]